MIKHAPLELGPSKPGQFLSVLNFGQQVFPNKKPRGSFNYNNIDRPQMIVDRMDSIKSMKSKNYVDPFVRTNQALLKRLDSIGSVFNKTSNNAHANIELNNKDYYYSGISSYVSQASKRFGCETPIFKNDGISRRDMSEMDDKMSTTFDGFDTKMGLNNQNPEIYRNSQVYVNSPNINHPFAKSEVSVVSMNEICDFEDYIPFRSTFNLEKIDEEKPVALEEQKSNGGEKNK